jgi:hypothetical protein
LVAELDIREEEGVCSISSILGSPLIGKHLPCPEITEDRLPIAMIGFYTHGHLRDVMFCTGGKVDMNVGKNEKLFKSIL